MDIDAATAVLADAGLDIVHPFDALACAREPGLGMLDDAERPVGLLVGNTRAMWPRFLDARRADAALAADEHPIQRYVEMACAKISDARVFYAHRRYDGAWLPFQRLAVAAGLGTLAPTQLVIHHEYGPWFALRAVLVGAGVPTTRRLPTACRCAAECTIAFERARATSGPDAWRAWLAVRDACPVGRNFRYSEDQILYHYTKDRAALPQAG